jgi:hypothetical protein
MDPRVKLTPDVTQIFTLSTQAETHARTATAAYKDARALADKIKAKPQSAASDALLKRIDELAPEQSAEETGGGGRGGRGGFGAAAPATPANLSNIAARLVASVMPMQASELPPTAPELRACHEQEAAYAALMERWTAFKARVNSPPAPKAVNKQ